jgi:glutathionyl-hydroquinone reductase
LAFDKIAETVDIDHIKRGYYSIKALNPNGIVPLGPDLQWFTPRLQSTGLRNRAGPRLLS